MSDSGIGRQRLWRFGQRQETSDPHRRIQKVRKHETRETDDRKEDERKAKKQIKGDIAQPTISGHYTQPYCAFCTIIASMTTLHVAQKLVTQKLFVDLRLPKMLFHETFDGLPTAIKVTTDYIQKKRGFYNRCCRTFLPLVETTTIKRHFGNKQPLRCSLRCAPRHAALSLAILRGRVRQHPLRCSALGSCLTHIPTIHF
jgi:hypothetical protein